MLHTTPSSSYIPSRTLLPHSLLFSSSTSSHQPCLLLQHHNFNTQYLHLTNFSRHANLPLRPKATRKVINCSTSEPLKVMISGAPASGKGTQCELIVNKYGLVHISTGDLLRAEVAAGTEIGKKAKEFMNAGRLVPDEIVTAMVAARLSCKDVKQKGWLLDGYPRSLSQAESLEKMQIRPDVYIVLDVHDEILIDRCVGRRLDPVTGKIYHEKFFPPETEEIKARLVTRPDDTEEKVMSRLNIYKQNAESVSSSYSNITNKIDGSRPKEEVFKDIESLLSQLQQDRVKIVKSGEKPIPGMKKGQASLIQDKWRGIPTRLNNIPHSREMRKYFYDDVLLATQRAINDGKTRLKSGKRTRFLFSPNQAYKSESEPPPPHQATNHHTSTPNLLLRLIMTLPVSTATTERSFSAMKIIKSKLRNKMGPEYLADSMSVYIEREISACISSESIIDDFKALGKRKVHL